MAHFPCSYLHGEVELTDERSRHIARRHPELMPEHRDLIGETLADPDEVRRSVRFGSAKLFSRWYNDLRAGKHVVVIVVSENATQPRHWVITAYMARKLGEGVVEWKRS